MSEDLEDAKGCRPFLLSDRRLLRFAGAVLSSASATGKLRATVSGTQSARSRATVPPPAGWKLPAAPPTPQLWLHCTHLSAASPEFLKSY